MCLGIQDSGDGKARCCGGDAIEDARKVCEKLGIEHHVFDYAAEMEKKVIAKFASEYLRVGLRINASIAMNISNSAPCWKK